MAVHLDSITASLGGQPLGVGQQAPADSSAAGPLVDAQVADSSNIADQRDLGDKMDSESISPS
jgi:hypothetical protein